MKTKYVKLFEEFLNEATVSESKPNFINDERKAMEWVCNHYRLPASAIDFQKLIVTDEISQTTFTFRRENGVLFCDTDNDVVIGVSEEENFYLPFRFGKANGNFAIVGGVVGLEGSPKEVNGWFRISDNPDLRSLEHSPINVTDYKADNLHLNSLKGISKNIGGNLSLWRATLKTYTFYGLDKTVTIGGDIRCDYVNVSSFGHSANLKGNIEGKEKPTHKFDYMLFMDKIMYDDIVEDRTDCFTWMLECGIISWDDIQDYSKRRNVDLGFSDRVKNTYAKIGKQNKRMPLL